MKKQRANRTQLHMKRTAAAVLAAASFTLLAAGTSLAYGPGSDTDDKLTVNYYGPGNDNNPAYNTGWDENKGPGHVGQNPMGDREKYEKDVYGQGPSSEAAKKLQAEDENALYIHSTYRGGTWEQTPEGGWKLKKENGQYVSSEWAYVDGKTYIIDMYGNMLTGWWKINSNWYYFNSVGAMQTGWLLKEGKYYFLNTDGTRSYGWVNTQGDWYFFDLETGVMLTNTYTPDGRYVNAEGILV